MISGARLTSSNSGHTFKDTIHGHRLSPLSFTTMTAETDTDEAPAPLAPSAPPEPLYHPTFHPFTIAPSNALAIQRFIDVLGHLYIHKQPTSTPTIFLSSLPDSPAKRYLLSLAAPSFPVLIEKLCELRGRISGGDDDGGLPQKSTSAWIQALVEAQEMHGKKGADGGGEFEGVIGRLGRIREGMVEDAKIRNRASTIPIIFSCARLMADGDKAVLSRLSRSNRISPVKTRVYRITRVTCSYPLEDGERSVNAWIGCRGVFVVLEEGAGIDVLEERFMEGIKEADPENVGVLEKKKKVVFWEEDGPLITERVWKSVMGVVEKMEAEIMF